MDLDNFHDDEDERTRRQIEGMIEAEKRAVAARKAQEEECECKEGMFPKTGRRTFLAGMVGAGASARPPGFVRIRS